MNDTVRVTMLGRLAVISSGVTTARFRSRRVASLIAYLAYYPNLAHARELLAEQFWPDASHEAGRMSLRVALNSLRKILEPPSVRPGSILEADRVSVRLNPRAGTTDVSEFERTVNDARVRTEPAREIDSLRSAVQLYVGPLLPELDDEWVVRERERLAWTHHEAVGRLRDALIGVGNLDEAIPYARLCAAGQPYEDSANEVLLRLLINKRMLTDARKHYLSFKSRLAAEVGLEPSPDMRKLAESLETINEKGPQVRVQSFDPKAHQEIELRRAPNVLPLPFTRLFGRDEEIRWLTSSLDPTPTARLVSIIGPGGCGKTRLLIETIHRIGAAYPGGVWFVDLSGLSEAAQIPNAITSALGLQDRRFLANALSAGPTLLALDNMEHLIPEGEFPVVRDLLETSPELVCLATSRQRLGLEGETVLILEPLGIPPAEVGLAELAAVPSVAMFVDRARQKLPHFALSASNADAVRRVCQLLEGLPLSIELAAAWSHTVSPAEMVTRLERDNSILVTRNRDVPNRHRSLRAVLQSSIEVLPSTLLDFLGALSTFRGGWTEDAARYVGERRDPLEMLASLQERSLIYVRDWRGSKRFSMMESIREFVAESLEPERWRRVTDLHATYFEQMTGRAEKRGRKFDQLEWLARVEVEEDNIQAALTWSASEYPVQALRILCNVADFWEVSCRDPEVQTWLERLLEIPDLEPGVRASGFYHLARVHNRFNRHEDARSVGRIAVTLSRQEALPHLEATCCLALGISLLALDRTESRVTLREGFALSQRLGYIPCLVDCLMTSGRLAFTEGRLSEAREDLGRALLLAEKERDVAVISELQLLLSEMFLASGDFVEASELARKARVLLLETRDKLLQPWALFHLGRASCSRGKYVDAGRHLQKGLRMFEKVGLHRGLGRTLVAMGDLNLALRRWEHAKDSYRRAITEAPREANVSVGARRGLALMELESGDVFAAVQHLLDCFAVEGTVWASETLRLLDACAICLSVSGLGPEAERLAQRVARLRGTTGLVPDRLDGIPFECVSIDRAAGSAVEIENLATHAHQALTEIQLHLASEPDRPGRAQ